MEYKEYLFKEDFEIPAFEGNSYFQNKVSESFQKSLENRNLHLESAEIINQETFEIQHYYTKYGVVIRYSARERNQDDDVRERIEFMIENLA